eukprot:CAMPEP_0117649734 /NCGR_PEP_ID=MMETSP0804-20121206/1146_1 /TAXON_ID=1074897 /ORGANISM="Tetraselmis astigmatica, Strain CCMP880" /LENGTH=644 /DNA_ID=CAMNT_0005455523 /DNA_START=86 /DNA_END=2020 /DNA_ORIENTATION=-
MALSRKLGAYITAAAGLATFAALFVPLPHSGNGSADGSAKCPLGYEGDEGVPLPADHPPIPGNAKQQQQAAPPRQEVPDSSLLFVNAHVWTGDPQAPMAEAFRVSTNGEILEVGSTAALLATKGGYSKTVDLQGNFVVPGFVDAHIHLMQGALEMDALNLAGIGSPQELAQAVQAAVVAAEPGEWVLGHSWDEASWGGQLPEASWIDQVSQDVPVVLDRVDKHGVLANTAAIKAAGITSDTPDPPGGSIVRDSTGRPTGLLRDSAVVILKTAQPPVNIDQRFAALERAMKLFLAKGITQVIDVGMIDFMWGPEAAWRDLEEVYMPAANDGKLKLRVHTSVPLSTWRDMAEMTKNIGWSHPQGFLSWGTVKAFADGSIGSHTALMYQPFGGSNSTGIWAIEKAKLIEDIVAADAAGLQVAVHAIGDRAVDEVLACFAEARTRNGPRAASLPRHRIEHAEHVAGPDTIRGLKEANVFTVTNPLHLAVEEQSLLHALGPERASPDRSYAFKSMIEAGVPMATGSDWPVAFPDALGGVHAAMYRRLHEEATTGRAFKMHAPPIPEGGLSPEDALAAHTTAADAHLMPGNAALEPGIKVGTQADFVVLSGDPLSQSPGGLSVLETYVGGVKVYSSADEDFHHDYSHTEL